MGEPAFQYEFKPTPARYVSESVYWQQYYEGREPHSYEWNNGVLEEKPVSDYLTGKIMLWFQFVLQQFLHTHPIAGLTTLDFGFTLQLPGKRTIRKPDLAVIRDDNPRAIQDLDRSYRGTFDLCVEALSDSAPGEAERDLVTKKAEYEAGGVQEYFILHWDARKQAFFRRNEQGHYLHIKREHGVIASQVLPGFQFRVADLLTRPDLETLAEDSVYQGFILTKTQQALRELDAKSAALHDLETENAALRAQLAMLQK